MIKPYVFNGISYEDLESLSKAYIENFDLGMDDIYKNVKELVRFIKSRINNKEKIKKYVEILSDTKYKSNALTFLIFEMTDHKEIYIAGVKMDLLTYLQALRENPDPANNILFGFLEDGGISKTFQVRGEDPKLCSHAKAIEKNYRNPFTYKYLIAYYGYSPKESLNGKIRSIAINGEECFRRFSKLASEENFQMSLATIAGFTDAIEAIKDINPTFIALKLLKKETEEEYLRKIVDGAFFWWALDNFDKYDYKPKASKIYRKYVEIKKEYDEYQEQIKQKKISSISFDNYIDISKRLYLNYLCFVDAFHNELISVKKKYDPEKYDPNKPYCKTYITQDFMQGKVIKLYTDKKPEVMVDPVSGRVIDSSSNQENLDDISSDSPVLVIPEEEKQLNLEKQKKRLFGQYGFNNTAIVLGLLFLVPVLFMVIVAKFNKLAIFSKLSESYKTVLGTYGIYIFFGVFVLMYLIASISMERNKESQYALKKFDKLSNLEANDFLDEEKILYKQEKEKLYKSSFKAFIVSGFFVEVCLGLLVAFMSIFIMATISPYVTKILNFDTEILKEDIYITLSSGTLLGIIFGLIFQKESKLYCIIISFVVFILSLAIMIVI